jgi:arylsulfatase A-like enzyme
VSPALVESVDLYPTVAALAGLPPPPDLDGVDLTPLMSSKLMSSKPALSGAKRTSSAPTAPTGAQLQDRSTLHEAARHEAARHEAVRASAENGATTTTRATRATRATALTAMGKAAVFSEYPRCPKNVSTPWDDTSSCVHTERQDFTVMG